MSGDDSIPPLSEELSDLVIRERELPPVDEALRARLRSRLGEPAGSPGSSSNGGAGSAAGYALATTIGLVLGTGFGAWGHAAWTEENVRPPEVVSEQPVASPAPASALPQPAAEPHAAEIPRARPSPAPAIPRTSRSDASTRASLDDSLSREQRVLDVARGALARGNPAQALRAVQRHEESFATGQLVEEREVLAIRALLRLGRSEDARARAARFREERPDSFLLFTIDRLVAEATR